MTGIQKKKPIYLVEKTCKRWRKLSLYNVTFSSKYTWQGYVKYMRMIHLVNLNKLTNFEKLPCSLDILSFEMLHKFA